MTHLHAVRRYRVNGQFAVPNSQIASLASILQCLRAYLNQLEDLLKPIGRRLAIDYRLEFKNLFGDVAGYVNGKIFVSC
jgi:hypothetical protein